MKPQILITSAVVIGMVLSACSRSGDQGPGQQQPQPPAIQDPNPLGIPGAPLPSAASSGLADNSRRAHAIIMGQPVVNVSFITSNFNENSGICEYTAIGAAAVGTTPQIQTTPGQMMTQEQMIQQQQLMAQQQAALAQQQQSQLTAINPELMMYFSETKGFYRTGYKMCRIHEAASMRFDFDANAILTVSLQMGTDVFRGTRIPYAWNPQRRELLISHFELQSANPNSRLGDVIEVRSSQRRTYLDNERRAYPAIELDWQPDVTSRGHLTPQAALGASQLRLASALIFDFGKMAPQQTIQINGGAAGIKTGSYPMGTRRVNTPAYFIPVQGTIMNPQGTTPYVPVQ